MGGGVLSGSAFEGVSVAYGHKGRINHKRHFVRTRYAKGAKWVGSSLNLNLIITIMVSNDLGSPFLGLKNSRYIKKYIHIYIYMYIYISIYICIVPIVKVLKSIHVRR